MQLNDVPFNGTLNQKAIITFYCDGELHRECLKLLNKRAATKEIKSSV